MQLNILNKLLEYNILQTLLHIIALCSGRKSTERWWGCCLRIYVCKPHIPMIFSIQNWVTSFNANKLKVKNYREIFRPSQLAKMFCENWINRKNGLARLRPGFNTRWSNHMWIGTDVNALLMHCDLIWPHTVGPGCKWLHSFIRCVWMCCASYNGS